MDFVYSKESNSVNFGLKVPNVLVPNCENWESCFDAALLPSPSLSRQPLIPILQRPQASQNFNIIIPQINAPSMEILHDISADAPNFQMIVEKEPLKETVAMKSDRKRGRPKTDYYKKYDRERKRCALLQKKLDGTFDQETWKQKFENMKQQADKLRQEKKTAEATGSVVVQTNHIKSIAIMSLWCLQQIECSGKVQESCLPS
jgi:hypothetical protein